MKKLKFDKSAGALLVFALAYFFDSSGMVLAVIPAAAVHEIGHIAALRTVGAKIRGLRGGLLGLRIDYHGALSREARLFGIIAGPAAGALYSLLALLIGGEFMRFSGMVSALLTAFNLLPIRPLDGGRILDEVCEKNAAHQVSLIGSAALILLGFPLLFKFGALSLLLSGVWLFIYNML